MSGYCVIKNTSKYYYEFKENIKTNINNKLISGHQIFQISESKGGTAINIPGDASDGSANDTFMKTNNAATGGIFKIKSTHEFDTSQAVTETAKTVTSVITASNNMVNMTNHGFVTGDEVTYTSSSAAGGLTTATTYYVVRNDDNSFLFS